MEHTRYTLIKRLRDQSNEEAWTSFTALYENYIYAVLINTGATHDEATDLRQDILLKLWKKLPEFDFQSEKGKFRTWLSQVIRNTAFTYFTSTGAERERVLRYFRENDPEEASASHLNTLLESEWKKHLTQLALENVEQTTSPQSIQIFKRMLNGESATSLASEFDLKENSIHRIKNRTRDKVAMEIARLRQELE
jgi:RNA polymerase sigma factor (sigma-70 family)